MSASAGRILSPQFLLLWVGAFTFFLSFYLLLPALPLYARGLGIPESLIGLIIGFFAVSSMLVKPVAGWAADRFGRRPLMLAGSALFVAASLLYGVSRTAIALLGVRLVHGTGMGLYPTGSAAMVADLAPPARRGEILGFWGAASNVALALGPLIAVWLSGRLGFSWLFAISAAVALAALALAVAQRETLPAPAAVRLGLGAMLSRRVAYPCVIVFCLMWIHGLMAAYLPLYAESQGTNPGLFFLVLALVVAAVRGYAGQVSDRLGRAPVAAIGLVLTAAALAALAAGRGPWGLVLAGALHGLGFGTAQPPLMAWTVDLVPAPERGKAMGTYYTALELGIAAGAIGSGMMLPHAGFRLLFLLTAALPATGAALALARLRRAAR